MNKTANTDLFWRKRLNPRLFLVLLLTALVLTPIAVAQNTAMFRADPAHTGVYSSGSEQVVPLALLWQFPTSGWVTSTPAIADGLAYSISADGNLYAIDINTGQKVWSKSIGNSQSSFFVISSASVYNGIVYAGGFDNYLHAFDAKTGLERWRFQTGGVITSSPVMETSNSFVYFVSSDGNLYAVHDGTEAWRFRVSAGGSSDTDPWIHNQIRSSPALDTATGIIYVGSWDNAVYAIRGGPVTSNGGTQVWKHATGGHVTSSPAIDKDNRFILVGCDDNQLYALKMDDNGNEAWKYRTSGDGLDRGWLIEGSPAVYNNVVYFGCGGYTFYAMDVRTHAILWTFRTSLGTETSPAIANGNVYFGSRNGNVYALDMSSGEKKWEFATGDVVYSSPAVSNGVLYIGSNTGKVYAIGKMVPQPPVIEWQTTFGGTGLTTGEYVLRTSDNGIIAGGETTASDGNITGTGFHGMQDIIVVKFLPDHRIEWARSYGGSDGGSVLQQILEIPDGYLLVGKTAATLGDVEGAGHHGSSNDDIWLIKIDKQGNIFPGWSKCYGGTKADQARSVIPTSEGGFIISGFTESNDGDFDTMNHGGNTGTYDAFMIKIDSNGTILWKKCFGGSKNDEAMKIVSSPDGSGYLVTGATSSNDGEVAGKNHGGDSGTKDLWVFKTDTNGNLLWSVCFGEAGNEEAGSIQMAPDNNYVITGWTDSKSTSNPMFANHGDQGTRDLWYLKINPNGELISINRYCFGGSGDDWGSSIRVNNDSILILGTTASNDGDVEGLNHGGNSGTADLVLFKLDNQGNIIWKSCYGGKSDDFGHRFGIQNTPDPAKGYVIGSSMSIELPGHHGVQDMWIVQFRAQSGAL